MKARLAALVFIFLAGCEQRMHQQPKYEALEPSPLFPEQQAARWPPAGTIPRSQPRLAKEMPAHMSRKDVQRGRERFEIYCAPCHGILGKGDGPVVQRGFPSPPSYHSERLRQVKLAHFFEVITYGHGIMYAYADRVAPADRWRIALYIRALQQSQHTDLDQYPQFRRKVEQAVATGEDQQAAGGDR